MGNFSRNTFNKLRHYVGVRLQQGVPLVDADWNEMEDIRKYELQAFLKWFVGKGVPKGNDGFRILPVAGSDNDFTIKGGDGTAEGAGRCLVDGWDVMNESNLRYTEQSLYNNAALAETWGVAPLEMLETPGAERTDTVYLDIWEREVDSEEDNNLVNPLIGIETCVRTKREWVVRVAEGATAPPDPPTGHVFYPLASLIRPDEAAILEEHITDLRLTGLSIMSDHDIQQIVIDAFGTSYTLDHDSQPNLKVSLREAINAILRGGLPSTPEVQLTSEAAYDYNHFVLKDNRGDIWVFWESYREGNGDIWYKCYSLTNETWTGDTRLTTDEAGDSNPFAIVDSSGDIWVFWYSYRDGNGDIYYRRYDYITSSWDTSDNRLTTDAANDYNPFAVVDSSGDIWVFWQSYRNENYDIYYRRYDHTTSSWDTSDNRLTTDAANDYNPFAIVDGNGDIWVFWQSYRDGNGDIYYKRYYSDGGYWSGDIRLTTDPAGDYNAFAMVDNRGDIWVFWESYRGGSNNIYYKLYTSDAGWGREVQLTASKGGNENIYSPFALEDSSGDIWGFWLKEIYGDEYEYAVNIWYKKLIPAI
jgi:hypothetical protein